MMGKSMDSWQKITNTTVFKNMKIKSNKRSKAFYKKIIMKIINQESMILDNLNKIKFNSYGIINIIAKV